MTPRVYDPSDVPGILRLWNLSIRETLITFRATAYREDDLAALLAARDAAGHATFVVGDQQVLGFATYAQFRGGDGYAHTTEHSIMLDERMRGQGAGRALMDAIEDHARGAGIHTNFAVVSSGNPAGVPFHERLGYRQVGTWREVGRKWDPWLDAHVLQKRLSAPIAAG